MVRRGARALAVVGLAAASASGQGMPQMQAPNTNSLLNDLRAIQFQQGGQQQQQQPGFGGGFGGGAVPPQQGGFGGMPQGFGGMPQGFGGGAPAQPAAVGTPMYAGGMGGGMGMPAGGMGQGGMGMGGMGMPPAGGMGAMPMGQGMGGAPMMQQQQQQQMQQQQMQQQQQAEAPIDFACLAGPRAAGWQAAKGHFRAIFEGQGSPLVLPSREIMSAALDAALRDLKAVDALNPQAPDECGLGKLCLQLMSFATVDDPAALVQLFTGLEQVSSPVMTLLLDVPWAATAQSGWPLFALLGTLNMRKGHVPQALNSPEVDGLHDQPGQMLLAELGQALQVGDVRALELAGASFLSKESQGGSALAPLTALAVQALGSSAEQRVGLLQTLQTAFRQVIGSAPELDIALSTNWPLWGLMQLNIDSFVGA